MDTSFEEAPAEMIRTRFGGGETDIRLSCEIGYHCNREPRALIYFLQRCLAGTDGGAARIIISAVKKNWRSAVGSGVSKGSQWRVLSSMPELCDLYAGPRGVKWILSTFCCLTTTTCVWNWSISTAGLLKPDLPDRLRNFIAHLTVHESVESDILFKKYAKPRNLSSKNIFSAITGANIRHFKRGSRTGQESGDRGLQNHPAQFFAFDAFVESHLRDEERFLFPVLRKKLSPQLLMALGAEAESGLTNIRTSAHHSEGGLGGNVWNRFRTSA